MTSALKKLKLVHPSPCCGLFLLHGISVSKGYQCESLARMFFLLLSFEMRGTMSYISICSLFVENPVMGPWGFGGIKMWICAAYCAISFLSEAAWVVNWKGRPYQINLKRVQGGSSVDSPTWTKLYHGFSRDVWKPMPYLTICMYARTALAWNFRARGWFAVVFHCVEINQ